MDSSDRPHTVFRQMEYLVRRELSASWRAQVDMCTHTHIHTQNQMQPHTYTLLLAQNAVRHA